MPELPEVEHTGRNLTRWMRGARIAGVSVLDPRIIRPTSPRAFTRALAGRRVERVERRGKWLRLGLDDGRKVFVHLGMTGWFVPSSVGAPPVRFERVHFDVDRRGRRSRIAYVDPRRWGRMVLARDDTPTWSSLGPDPLADRLDLDALATKLARRKRSIKEVLLDQRVLAGVGNIQAIEALWRARIDPRSRASALSSNDVRALVRGLTWTLLRTLADLAKGDAGADNPFRIYGRRGEPCPRCGKALARVELGGRTTTFCPACQVRR